MTTTNPNDMPLLLLLFVASALYAGLQLLGVRELTKRFGEASASKKAA